MSFFGFLGKVLTGGISVATHGLINLGGGGGGVPPASALPLSSFAGPTRGGFGGSMPTFSMPGAGRGFSAGPGPGAGSSLIPHMACDRGMHHAKHKGALGGLLASKCVRNRHMNVTNPRALRRSIRRLTGFEKLARRVLRITTHKPVTIHGFKRGRKRRS